MDGTASADTLTIDTANGCRVHNPNPRPGETVTWSGRCPDGVAQGPGTLTWYLDGVPNGRFEGNLVRGRVSGQGTAHYPSGSRYSGGFREGVPDGLGTFYFPDGRRFIGGWTGGKPDGPGVMFDPDGFAAPQTWDNGVLQD